MYDSSPKPASALVRSWCSRKAATSAVPYGARAFDIEFDFVDHMLHLRTSDGGARSIALESMPVADFHVRVGQALEKPGVPTTIQDHPNEVESAVPFSVDYQHHTYDPRAAQSERLQHFLSPPQVGETDGGLRLHRLRHWRPPPRDGASIESVRQL